MTKPAPMAGPMKIELIFGPVANHTARLTLDGIDVSKHVRAVTFYAGVGELTTARLELVNIDVSLDGKAFVDGVIIPIVTEGIEDITGLGDETRRYKPTKGDAA